MNRIKTILAAILLLALPLVNGHGDEPRKVPELMQRKLTASQKILEGVAIGDYKLIARHADELIQISKEAEWKVIKTAQYEVHSSDFRRTAEELIKNAKDKNLDAAALTYVDLTLGCVKCHKYVREVRMASRD